MYYKVDILKQTWKTIVITDILIKYSFNLPVASEVKHGDRIGFKVDDSNIQFAGTFKEVFYEVLAEKTAAARYKDIFELHTFFPWQYFADSGFYCI